MGISQTLFLVGGGYYQVQSIGSAVSVVLKNLGYAGNASPLATVATAAKVSPGGLVGVTGTTGATGPMGATGPTGSTGATGATGVTNFVGLFDASGAAFPTTGVGGGAIVAGDRWKVSVAGTVGSKVLRIGDELVAQQNAATLDAHFYALDHISRTAILSVENAADNAISSVTYVDVPLLTVTLPDMGDTLSIEVYVDIAHYNTLTTAANFIQIVIGGVAVTTSVRQVATVSGFTFFAQIHSQTIAAAQAAGTVVKVQAKVSSGTGHFVTKSLIVRCVPTSKIF